MRKMKNIKTVLIMVFISFVSPAMLFANGTWDGGGSTNLWSEGANWGGDAVPLASETASVNLASKMPLINAGTTAVCQSLNVGTSGQSSSVTQTGGSIAIGHEVALGHNGLTGTYTISGGSLNVVNHLLLSDNAASTGVFQVNGTGATSITASYQLQFRSGTGHLKFVLDAAGVTPINATRLNMGSGAARILTVDASAYTGPEADIVLVNYPSGKSGSTFSTVNLSGGAQSISLGTNKLTVHVVSTVDVNPPTPNPATFAIDPHAISVSAITMVATTGTDLNGPVEYYFTETSGNPGGTDSGWQTSPSYTDTGLIPSTLYTYTVRMRDRIGNTGTASIAINATTEAGSSSGLIPVWKHRVDPATHPGALARKIMPVTWEDQDDIVLLPVAGGMNLVDNNTVNMPAYQGYLDYWTSGLPDSTTAPFGFESQFYSSSFFSFTTNYNQVVDEWVSRDSYIAGCYGPGGWTYDGFFSLPNPNFPGGIPDAVHNYVLSQLGGRFGGWEYGENDGGYGYGLMPENPPTGKVGHDYFLGFNHRWSEKLHNYMVSMQNTTWGPYMADTSYCRKIGVQTPNQMYNINMWAGLLRGASRQNGVLWWPNIDSYWGLNGGQKNWGVPGGENWGNSVSLIRRATYLYFMYGACAIQPAAPHHISADVAGTSTDILSPFGEIAVDIRNFMRAHPYPDLGTAHMPVALVWDYYTGWLPPRTTGGWAPYMVWGKSSYAKGEHQIDMLFRMLFPHYEDSAFFLNERGFLTETPCGDIFDVVLSNVPRYVLNQYDAAVVIGSTKIEGQLQITLQDFIDRGGSVATTAAQLTSDSGSMFGVQLTGTTSIETTVNWTAGGSVTENNFKLHHLNLLPGASVVAQTPAGYPVVVKYATAAGGELIVFAADYGLTEWSGSISNAGVDQPLYSPYQLLSHMQTYLGPWMKKWNLIEVTGPAIQYLTNVTEDSDRFIVTLCNNVETTWTGSVSLKGANIALCKDLITGQSFGSGSSVPVTVGGDNLVILEITSASPLVQPKNATPTPAPTADELVLKGDQAFEKWDKFTPQGMLAMSRPSALSPAQGSEPSGALYVNAWLFDGMSPDTWIPAVKYLGLKGVEIRATQLYRDDMAALWSKLASQGLRVGAVHAGVDMPPFSFGSIASNVVSDREPTLQWLELTMELMRDAGINRLILYPGYTKYGSPAGYNSNVTLASLNRLKTKAQSCGVTIMVETAYGQDTYATTSSLQGLISSVNSSWVKTGMNTANTQLTEGSFSTTYAQTWDYVHLSNYKLLPNGLKRNNYTPLTDGVITTSTFNSILSSRQGSGRATCIYMLNPDRPIGVLCDFLNKRIPGDFNQDGVVDITDLAFLASRWLNGNCGANNHCDGADLDLTGRVDFLDFSIFAEYYGF
jgi:hypothetical protein